ncbi:MAG: beta-galactosidase trimerization domain-containing protein [Phycisphaerae bacterium]
MFSTCRNQMRLHRAIATLITISACAAPILAQAQPTVTRETLQRSLDDLKALAASAKTAGVEPLYADAILMVGPAFVGKQWDAVKDEKKRDDWAAYLDRRIRAETAQLNAAIAARKDPRVVPPVPDYAKLTWKDNYLTLDGKPVLIITAGNSGGGTADPRLAGKGDLYGIVSAVGASRYDYQDTPIWPLYKSDPKSHRVYDGGWCGHIIKDKWSDGGQGGKTECVISLDYPPMLEAVRQSILKRCDRFKKQKQSGRQKILAMDWEFTYMNYDEPTKDKWQKWLKERYKSIDKLNGVWKTDLKTFEDVTLPPVNSDSETNPAKYYDFGEFNLWRFTDYLLWAKNVIKAEVPGYPMCVGGGQPFGRGFWKEGNDEEYLAVSGVDDVWLSETGSRSWGTASFMDLQHSIAPKMAIMDPEYHGMGGFMSLMFFHGCGTLDCYDWKQHENASLPHGLSMDVGALDVRRLQEYIVEFPKAVPQAAILYSRASMIQRFPGKTGKGGVQTPYTLELEKCYRAGTVLDTGMGFITTRMAKEGVAKSMPGLKVLIVPGAYFANEDEVKKIEEFVKAGGTLVMMPTSFVADEYDRRRDYLKAIGVEIVQETVPQYLAKKATSGLQQPGSEYDFIQGPIAKTVVEDAPTAKLTWHSGKPGSLNALFTGAELAGAGIKQAVKLTGQNEVLASYEDKSPAIVRIPSGKGAIYYVAMQMSDQSTSDFLNYVYDQAKVERPVRIVDAKNQLVPGIESRTVPYKGGQLTYIYNMNDTSATVRLHAPGAAGVTNLTAAAAMKPDAAIDLGPYEWVVLELKK